MKKLLTLALIFASLLNLLAADKRPNILFILADDTGIDDYSCYGSDRFKGRTPNIDALAKSGLRFERCYASPLCGPSRSTLTTGRYVFRTGAINNPITHATSFKDEPSVARTLKQAGYATGMARKWRQMGDAPYVEKLVATEGQSGSAKTARQKLQAVLDELNPATGKNPAPAGRAAKRPRRLKN